MSSVKSVSAPSTPTEQEKQIHSNIPLSRKKEKQNKVHFPLDDKFVTCYLEPPDPWSPAYSNTIETLMSSYLAASDKQGIKPLCCVLDQLQEFENNSFKLKSDPRTFDLSILGEKLSMKHCEALEEILRRMQFHLIDLEGCYLEDEGAAALFDMIEYYDSASHLNISFTKHIDNRGWQACSRMLKKTTSLVHLNARSTGLSEQVLLIVGRALRLGSNLVTLHLENCGIFGRCLVILVAALKLNTTLRELFLAENRISSADGFQLGNLLRTNTHLELLDLSNNKLGDDGLIHLMESLGQQSNTSGRGLSTLILWNNELTVKGMPCISRAITSARALKRVNLGSNDITSTGVVELKHSLLCNRTIEILELENAAITSEGAFALADYITQNQFLEKIDIRGNDIRLDGVKALSQATTKSDNITSLQIDPTPLDLNEPIKERQQELQEISRCCQKNKEAKSSLPPQDAELSTLFNGIFSHVLPTSNLDSPQETKKELVTPVNSTKGRFRVSLVINNEENLRPKFSSPKKNHPSEPVTHDTNLVSDRLKWLEDLSTSNGISDDVKMNDEVFLPSAVEKKPFSGNLKPSLCLHLSNVKEFPESEQKVRRLSSPAVCTAPQLPRKTHSIKCCKELEGLDLRSSVPLSPTHLRESFETDTNEVLSTTTNSQMSMKTSSYTMVH